MDIVKGEILTEDRKKIIYPKTSTEQVEGKFVVLNSEDSVILPEYCSVCIMVDGSAATGGNVDLDGNSISVNLTGLIMLQLGGLRAVGFYFNSGILYKAQYNTTNRKLTSHIDNVLVSIV